MSRKMPHFVPRGISSTDPTESRFPNFRIAVESTDLEFVLREAKNLGYRPREIMQTGYDSNNGHIRLYRSDYEKQQGLFVAISSEVVSHSLVYRLYVPVTDDIQVPRAITR